MKFSKPMAILATVAVGAAAFWYLQKNLTTNPAKISGVTDTTKSGPTGALTTTPIKLGNVAFVAANSTLETLGSIPQRIGDFVRSLSIPASVDKRQPFGNSASALNASDMNRDQLAGNYNPKAQAMF